MNGTIIGIFCVAALLFVISVVLLSGRGSFLIAGYNTMKKEEKEKYNEKKLCRGTGILMLLLTILCAVMGIAELLWAEAVVDLIAQITGIIILVACAAWIILGNLLCRK